jgi:ribosome-associated translation inhibitor RaiA
MSDNRTASHLVRHKLQVRFDSHEYEPARAELERLGDDLDSLAVRVGDFPQADLRVLIEKNGRNNEFVVKLTLLLSSEALVTSDHNAALHAAFRGALEALERAVEGHKERLEGVDARQRRDEAAKLQPTAEPGTVDERALDSAAAAGDYPAFRAAVAPFEDWLRLRVGRWVERYPDVQARMARDFNVLDLTEGVFLAAFEAHGSRHAEVRYRDFLDGLIDPTVKAFAHDPAGELENVNMARSAATASGGS